MVLSLSTRVAILELVIHNLASKGDKMTSLQFRTKDLDNFYKTAVGFDNMFDRIFNDLQTTVKDSGFPPYNIIKHDEENYVIEMAVAGFSEEELEVELKDGVLEVRSNTVDTDDAGLTKYLHRGIAKRNFFRKFSLSDDVIVEGANLVNGLLQIDLKRVIPEEKKPRLIPIGKSNPQLTE